MGTSPPQLGLLRQPIAALVLKVLLSPDASHQLAKNCSLSPPAPCCTHPRRPAASEPRSGSGTPSALQQLHVGGGVGDGGGGGVGGRRGRQGASQDQLTSYLTTRGFISWLPAHPLAHQIPLSPLSVKPRPL